MTYTGVALAQNKPLVSLDSQRGIIHGNAAQLALHACGSQKSEFGGRGGCGKRPRWESAVMASMKALLRMLSNLPSFMSKPFFMFSFIFKGNRKYYFGVYTLKSRCRCIFQWTVSYQVRLTATGVITRPSWYVEPRSSCLFSQPSFFATSRFPYVQA